MNMVTTMYSWFGHAEALSAQVAVRATLLAAIHGGLLSDDGLEATLRVDLDKAVRDLGEKFFDAQTGLVRPYPGLPLNPLWSAWVGRNLHSAVRSLRSVPALAGKLARALGSCEKMASSIDHTLKLSGHKASELGGYDPTQDGLEVIPVEVGGKVVYKVLTDDAVQRFAIDRLLPALRLDEKNSELAFSRAYDKFRFLSAFRRTGALQYLTEAAKALWLASGKRPEARQPFHSLFATISRGMIFTQEPGMIQGPALLGGVYSTPMAMVRYLELLLLVGKGSQLVPAGAPLSLTSASSGTAGQAFGKPIVARESLAIAAPAGAVVRIDFAGKVSLSEPTPGPAFAQATVSKHELRVAEEAGLTIQLDASRDPLEYYALVAVPTTTAIKQTEDILSDYKGQLIYGQQGTGGTKMQVIAVPFRGHRTINLLLEGLYPGSSPGLVAIRHLENPQQVSTLRLGEVRVRE
jgi:hypothetical protein